MNFKTLYDRLKQRIASTQAAGVSDTDVQALLEVHQQQLDKYEALAQASETIINDRDRLAGKVTELEGTIEKYKKMLFGRKSEKRPLDINYDVLLFVGPEEEPIEEPIEEPVSEEEQEVIEARKKALQLSDEEIIRQHKDKEEKKKSKKDRTEELPANLDRKETIYDLPESEKEGLKYIGDAVSERLRCEGVQLWVERIVRRQYVRPNKPKEGVVAPSPPLNITEGSKYGFCVHATLIASKFGLHLSTYRHQDLFAGAGWAPSRSTINELLNQSSALFVPFFKQLESMVYSDSIVLGDDTQIKLLTRGALSKEDLELLGTRAKRRDNDKERSGCITSYAWLYTGLDDFAPYNVFHWSVSRAQDMVHSHLTGFKGTLVGDAFGGNRSIGSKSNNSISFASCNAHARRKFIDAEQQDAELSWQAIVYFGQLYEIEQRGSTLSPSDRLELRRNEAEPVWRRFRQWLDGIPPDRRLPKSKLGEAVTYINNQWEALRLYLTDGRIPIDNLQSERTIRPLTIGRKNWMFLGHPRAAIGRMQLFSIVSSAARHHLMLEKYLESVLRELAYATQHAPSELAIGSDLLLRCLPDRWALAHPEYVKTFRREEQTDRAEKVRYRRACKRQAQRVALAADSAAT